MGVIGFHHNSLHSGGAWPTAINPQAIRLATLHWYDIEKSPGVYDWSKADATFAKIPLGVDVLWNPTGTPRFYSARPDEAGMSKSHPGSKAEPKDLETLKQFVKEFISRYPVSAVEGWNEPTAFFTGTPAMMADIQRAINLAVKSIDKSITVVSAPCVLHDSGIAYMDAMLRETTAYDVIGCHFYPKTLSIMEQHSLFWRFADKVAHREKPVWCTECGWIEMKCGTDFASFPADTQIALLQMTNSVMSQYCDRWYHFAYDDALLGFEGNAAVESAWGALA